MRLASPPTASPCGPSTSGRGAPLTRPSQAHSRRGQRIAALWGFGRAAPPKASPEVAWEAKYGEQQLRHGVDMQQGPREGMEDFTHLVEKARCGYLFACESPVGPCLQQPARPPPHRAARLPPPAAVYDGHGGKAAGQYLQRELYDVFSQVVDQGESALECALEGKGAAAAAWS